MSFLGKLYCFVTDKHSPILEKRTDLMCAITARCSRNCGWEETHEDHRWGEWLSSGALEHSRRCSRCPTIRSARHDFRCPECEGTGGEEVWDGIVNAVRCFDSCVRCDGTGEVANCRDCGWLDRTRDAKARQAEERAAAERSSYSLRALAESLGVKP